MPETNVSSVSETEGIAQPEAEIPTPIQMGSGAETKMQTQESASAVQEQNNPESDAQPNTEGSVPQVVVPPLI